MYLETIFDAAQRILNYIESISLPEKATITMGDIYLGIEHPEVYSDRLLQLIHARAQKVKEIMGGGIQLKIPDAAGEVAIMMVDSEKVKIYIPFSLSFKDPICEEENEQAP